MSIIISGKEGPNRGILNSNINYKLSTFFAVLLCLNFSNPE